MGRNRGWDREGLFPLWIFIPKSFGKISFVLGPANFLLFISAIIIFFKDLIFKNSLLNVGVFQFFFLIAFSQGRADYYMVPLIIITFGISKNLLLELNFLNFKFNNIANTFFTPVIVIQLLMFVISSIYSISLVLYVVFDYDQGMNKTAYNFYNSKKIERLANFPVYSEMTGMTHLFFDKPFIANQKFERCLYYEKNIPSDQIYKFCMNKENVKTIIVKHNKLKKNQSFTCKKEFLIRASRNVFLERKLEVDFCELK